ncbi:DNA polymerase IV-like protein ImuB [Thioalkalivibrio nitratireducens DSM 14787]|uniref:DNA polymerase IV-like protein ImuB n=1 Tax=Thioalkalivibrio nitratireducens (strain DSM 14787 / UNIQEM 213 / ALEN2) TaxID=1255043 RepID=L0DYV5_THIND|nr:DNA polymerase IV-like protein ImuB [Thioalkalivibrio nitratireducens DSM 14787]
MPPAGNSGRIQLALLPEASRVAPYPGPEPGRPLWLAVWLPHLALDALVQTGNAQPGPLIVVEEQGRPRVHDGNRAARRAGVVPGMPLADALAVLNAPTVVEHRPDTLELHLHTLASVLLQFSDHVCPEPDGPRILLEIGRSLRLFRGMEVLARQIADTLRGLGYSARIGIARTPAAARLLAGQRGAARPANRDALRRALSPLPLAALPLPGHTFAGLRAVGLRRIGELLRLPRGELAQRHGTVLPVLLDRLLGDTPEVLPRFRPPETPVFQLEFDREITTSGALRFPLRRLLLQMEHALRARQRGVQRLELDLLHRERTTRLALERSHAGSRADDWLELWNIRLSRLTLPAPVRALRLHPGCLLPGTTDTAGLFHASASGAPDDSTLLARIRARLGDRAVLRLEPTLHPLPEHAQAERTADNPPRDAPAAVTPAQYAAGAALWLCPPQPCAAPAAPAWLGRLEGGWWADGNDQRRDYALARDRDGRLLWLFRDLRSGKWQLLGFWG